MNTGILPDGASSVAACSQISRASGSVIRGENSPINSPLRLARHSSVVRSSLKNLVSFDVPESSPEPPITRSEKSETIGQKDMSVTMMYNSSCASQSISMRLRSVSTASRSLNKTSPRADSLNGEVPGMEENALQSVVVMEEIPVEPSVESKILFLSIDEESTVTPTELSIHSTYLSLAWIDEELIRRLASEGEQEARKILIPFRKLKCITLRIGSTDGTRMSGVGCYCFEISLYDEDTRLFFVMETSNLTEFREFVMEIFERHKMMRMGIEEKHAVVKRSSLTSSRLSTPMSNRVPHVHEDPPEKVPMLEMDYKRPPRAENHTLVAEMNSVRKRMQARNASRIQ